MSIFRNKPAFWLNNAVKISMLISFFNLFLACQKFVDQGGDLSAVHQPIPPTPASSRIFNTVNPPPAPTVHQLFASVKATKPIGRYNEVS
jgi:hypothetical protein